METTETRRVGKHLFIFEKANGNTSSSSEGGGGKSRTLIASCVNNSDEKLPREFVKYMRTLFDILDERRSGFVKLSDIEARWRRKSVNDLAQAQPSDVLENLRKVASSNGLLSFEKLCLGFQLALRPAGGKKEESRKVTVQEPSKDSRREVGSEKLRSREDSKKGDEKTRKNESSLVSLSKQRHRRPRSMVQLRQQKELDLAVAKRKGGILEGLQKTDKNAVIAKLRQWQKEAMRKAPANTSAVKETERAETSKPSSKAGNGVDTEHRNVKQYSINQDPARAKLPRTRVYYQGEKPNGLNGGSRETTTTCVVYKENVKTIISKETKLKGLEEELKVLGEGLSTVEEVRDWLFTRITAIQEEKLYVKSVERYSSQDYEALVHLMRRKELGLTSSSFKTFPKHMEELKSHFHQILQKPSDLSSAHESSDFESKRKIAQLEKEKSALIRELFQYKPKKDNMVCVK